MLSDSIANNKCLHLRLDMVTVLSVDPVFAVCIATGAHPEPYLITRKLAIDS